MFRRLSGSLYPFFGLLLFFLSLLNRGDPESGVESTDIFIRVIFLMFSFQGSESETSWEKSQEEQKTFLLLPSFPRDALCEVTLKQRAPGDC